MPQALFALFSFIAAMLVVAPAAVIAQQAPPTPVPSATPTLPPTPMPSETPLPSPMPSVPPTPTPTPSVSPTPSVIPTPSPAPSATPTPLPTPLVLPADAAPQILAVQVSDPVFHSGELVSGTVITSTNVAAVEIRLMGHHMRLPRTDFGVFQMSYTMPRVPFFLRKTYTAQVVAINSAGVQAERDISVSIR